MIRKNSKLAIALSKLTQPEQDKLGIEAQSMMEKEVQFLVYTYTKSTLPLVKTVLGWEREDLHAYMWETTWKGLVTFDPERGVKKITYVSMFFRNYLNNLIKACHRKKRQETKIYGVPFELEIAEESMNGEEWPVYQTNFEMLVAELGKKEVRVLAYHLYYGCTIKEISERVKMPSPDVISIIKNIKDKFDVYMDLSNERTTSL